MPSGKKATPEARADISKLYQKCVNKRHQVRFREISPAITAGPNNARRFAVLNNHNSRTSTRRKRMQVASCKANANSEEGEGEGALH